MIPPECPECGRAMDLEPENIVTAPGWPYPPHHEPAFWFCADCHTTAPFEDEPDEPSEDDTL